MSVIPFPVAASGGGIEEPKWLTLPVFPQAAARIRFRLDETPVKAIPLQGALAWIGDLLDRGTKISGLNLNGPGDPLATLAMTEEILTLLGSHYPSIALGITTLGLGLADCVAKLKEKGVSRVTLLVDAGTPQTAQALYSWIRPGKRNIPLAKGVEILLAEQAAGITACREAGLQVIVQTSVYAGINEQEIEEIARRVHGLGATSLLLSPGKGWVQEDHPLDLPSAELMTELAERASQYGPVVQLGETTEQNDIPSEAGASLPRPSKERPNVAVLSANGMDIDLHLGQAIKALIYGPREDGLPCLLEARDLPEPGSGDSRWQRLAEVLDDCFVLLAASAGQKPRDILGRLGLSLLLLEENVEGTVDVLYGGGKKGKGKKRGR